MKKIIISVFIVMLFFVSGCNTNIETENETKILHIENCGSLEIPNEWEHYVKDDIIYVTDYDSKPIMIQSYSFAGIGDNDVGIKEENDYFNIQMLKSLNSAVCSNGAVYGKNELLQDGEKTEKFILEIGYEKVVQFVIWDETIDLKYLKKLAKTFIAE